MRLQIASERAFPQLPQAFDDGLRIKIRSGGAVVRVVGGREAFLFDFLRRHPG
jgi:hypothetical protein